MNDVWRTTAPGIIGGKKLKTGSEKGSIRRKRGERFPKNIFSLGESRKKEKGGWGNQKSEHRKKITAGGNSGGTYLPS